jgi:exonuclease SbcC
LAEAERARTAIAQAEQALTQVTIRIAQLADLEKRLATGQEMVNSHGEVVSQLNDQCNEALRELGRDEVPSHEAVKAAARRAEAIRDIVAQKSAILSLREHFIAAESLEAEALTHLETIGPVTYDAAEHKAAVDALNAAQSAEARLAQINLELANRPTYENQRASTLATAGRLRVELGEATAKRTALNFQLPELEKAREHDRAAAARLREADRAVALARGQLQAAVRDRDGLLAEQERLANLARRSEIRRREHDELERMYREFGRFDQYVAQLVTPQLADYTGELLAEVTDHAYDHVVFDDNYGVRIYDGQESFPIDQFSGGERDVAALCARLALSRFIGAQAAHPPRFLVLDEVFGSLDADRRTQVLNALLKLAGNDGPFRQLFIISHVDDVRASASFDEVWRVQEVDGASMVENLSRTGASAEF